MNSYCHCFSHCLVVKCPNIGSIPHGSLAVIPSPGVGDNATMQCDDEYWYEGNTVRICQRNATWSGVWGQCKRMFFLQSLCSVIYFYILTAVQQNENFLGYTLQAIFVISNIPSIVLILSGSLIIVHFQPHQLDENAFWVILLGMGQQGIADQYFNMSKTTFKRIEMTLFSYLS